jgi:DNA polymerase/3'-5' exonuclease PolX
VLAYRHAAETLRQLARPVAEIVEHEGLEGLQKLPGIGESLARSIHALVTTGCLPMLDRLRGEADPIAVLASVPGIGRGLASRLHHDLSIDTLEELEATAYEALLRFRKKGSRGILSAPTARVSGRSLDSRPVRGRWRHWRWGDGQPTNTPRQRWLEMGGPA